MKTTKAIMLTLALLIVSVALISNVQAMHSTYKDSKCKPHPTPMPSYESFMLEATGTATTIKRTAPEVLAVELHLSGPVKGNSKYIIQLDVDDGTCKLGEQVIPVVKGTGLLIVPCGYLHLSILVSAPYGGRTAVWILSGKAVQTGENEWEIALQDWWAILPNPGKPTFVKVSLEGTITFS
jgi:hypothetical protein